MTVNFHQNLTHKTGYDKALNQQSVRDPLLLVHKYFTFMNLQNFGCDSQHAHLSRATPQNTLVHPPTADVFWF